MGNELKFKATLDDNVSGKLGKMRTEFDRLGGKGSTASLFGNVGAKAVAVGFSMIASSVDIATDAIGQAIHAAIEDQESQQKLGTALRANIANWDGNTAAIEKVLEARMALGFSDDDQRASLAGLVAATGDVTRALDIQRTAMDLARFKGISLSEASEALTKVEAGSYRILKSLGIVLKEGATQQDALNAVQRIATGQAEDYARTTGGKVLVAQTKMNEAMEKLGYVLLPAVAEGADLASSAIDALAKGFSIAASSNKGLNVSLNASIPIYGQLLQLADALGKANRETGRSQVNLKNMTGLRGHAEGGWVGLDGPELGLLGEKGPEYVISNNRLGGSSGSGFTIAGVSEREIVAMVDRGLYFKLRRAAPAGGRL